MFFYYCVYIFQRERVVRERRDTKEEAGSIERARKENEERERRERELKQQQERAGVVEIERLKKEKEELQRINNNNNQTINTLSFERDRYKSEIVIN